MKQVLLSIMMLLCVGNAFGQTPAKLIEKYKAVPGAVYENTTNESLKGLEEGDTILSADEIAKLKKHFKKSEQVQIQNVSEEQLAEINKDIKALKNYELLFETVRNAGSESLGDSANVVKQKISDFLNPTVKMRCYGKVDGKMVSDLLIRLDIWNTVALSYIDTKIDRDVWMKLQEKSSFSTSDDDDDDSSVDMKETLKDVEKGNVLIVINGEEHPELHSTKEAEEYMRQQQISFNHQNWIVGKAVKEKYPHTKKNVVIEFSRNDKEQK
ncbi:hypothetical protein SAMN04487900_10440 [Prevotella communis]|uniref:Uncharacterized protein n=1 Tax=Prevotella communis TaxID=2913614 RepID=A0A1H0ETK3_9BACT|nr:hypothetical protein [Prevotella communis]SDN85708.1 hypothetical protein SAMN04487900_10440 [Prevotella communis]